MYLWFINFQEATLWLSDWLIDWLIDWLTYYQIFSGIHDHADAHCWMKIMDGSLYENLYDWPEDQKKESISSEPKKMTPRKITEYHKNQVAYINGNLILFYAYLVRDGWFDLKHCLWLLSPNFASNVTSIPLEINRNA